MQLMIIQDSDRLKIGSIAAFVGMELANGYKIVKVNNKSAIARSAVPEAIAEHQRHTEKFFDPTSIFYTEAIAWGFPGKAGVDRRAESLAAFVRRFERGKLVYQQHQEHKYISPIVDSIEQAGYDFAKEVLAQKQLAISNSLVAQLETAEGEDSKKFMLTFEISTPTSDYKMFRTFETESENLARDEAIEMEWQLMQTENTKVLFEKLESCE